MKKILSNIFPAIPVAIVLGSMIFSHSCANTTTPPTGGPKDTIPPTIVEIYPALGQVNVPVHKTKLKLEFDEYVVVKDPKSLCIRSKARASLCILTVISTPTRHIPWM